jgi:hypothetical protein
MGHKKGLVVFLNLLIPERDFAQKLLITHCWSHQLALVGKHSSDAVPYLCKQFEPLMLRLWICISRVTGGRPPKGLVRGVQMKRHFVTRDQGNTS